MKKTYAFVGILLLLVPVLSSFGDVTKYHRNFSTLYSEMNLAAHGLSKKAMDYAIRGYENLLDRGLVKNSKYLSIVDFTKPLDSKRFYLIDVEKKELVVNTYVMHGKQSGKEIPENFSNKVNSHKSSLGFYITREIYKGARGLSLRLSGLEKGFNSNAEKRGVVVHGSNYISEKRAKQNKVLWSQGCPALPKADYTRVMRLIKNGSVLFIYHPSEDYLKKSPVLNG
jgi:hypothetical protein